MCDNGLIICAFIFNAGVYVYVCMSAFNLRSERELYWHMIKRKLYFYRLFLSMLCKQANAKQQCAQWLATGR